VGGEVMVASMVDGVWWVLRRHARVVHAV
jgi:hypothetical protein